MKIHNIIMQEIIIIILSNNKFKNILIGNIALVSCPVLHIS